MSYQTNNLVKEIFDKIFGKYCTFCLKNLSTGIYCSYIINSTYFRFTVIFLREEFILAEEFYEVLQNLFQTNFAPDEWSEFKQSYNYSIGNKCTFSLYSETTKKSY